MKAGLAVEGVSPTPPEPPAKASLSDEQKRIAKEMGMTEEDYIKYGSNPYGI